MKELSTINFRDVDSSDEAVAIIRYDNARVSLCLSLKADGDVEVVMTRADAANLVESLLRAINAKESN
jgi:hypothetical protein